MNAAEFFFALFAVFGASGLIFAWYSWIYSLDDAYQESIANKRAQKKKANRKINELANVK